MKKIRFLLASLLVLPTCPSVFLSDNPNLPNKSQASKTTISTGALKPKKNNAFKPGEVLTYRLHYGFIDAGIAVMEVKPQMRETGGRKVYHVVGNGYTKGTFDFFYKVRDRYESLLDSSALVPWVFIRRVDEGGFKFNQDYYFNRYNNSVNVGNNQVLPIRDETQDMISSFYAARVLDFSNAKPGDVFSVDSFVDKEHWPMNIRFIGRETINTDIGKVRCLVFRPVVQKGRVFKKDEDLKVWISDDSNHIPIRAEAKILIGSIKLDIISAVNTVSPIAKSK